MAAREEARDAIYGAVRDKAASTISAEALESLARTWTLLEPESEPEEEAPIHQVGSTAFLAQDESLWDEDRGAVSGFTRGKGSKPSR